MKIVINTYNTDFDISIRVLDKFADKVNKDKKLNKYYYHIVIQEFATAIVLKKNITDADDDDDIVLLAERFGEDITMLSSFEFDYLLKDKILIKKRDYRYKYINNRTDKDLIEIVEELGGWANTDYTNLKVVEIPDDVEWYHVSLHNSGGGEKILYGKDIHCIG